MDRFWSKVEKTDTCWNWTASTVPGGYGRFKLNGKYVLCHRLSFEWYSGLNPGEKNVCHTCDNPKCVNPHHLFLGSGSDNMLDCARKKRLNCQNNPSSYSLSKRKLTDDEVEEIKKFHIPGKGGNTLELAHRFQVDRRTIAKNTKRP